MKPYLICSTPRCGSTLLGRLLQQTGVMGDPREYLNDESGRTRDFVKTHHCIDDRGSIDTQKYLRLLREKYSSASGGFGIKTHFHHLGGHLNTQAVIDFANEAVWIWVRRQDVIAQAISYRIAQVTGSWTAAKNAHTPHPEFDAKDIEQYLRKILAMEANWRTFFAMNHRRPLTVVYEDLLTDPSEAIMRICEACGARPKRSVSLGDVDLTKQGTARNEEGRPSFAHLHFLT